MKKGKMIKSKAFKTPRRTQKGPTNKSPKAVKYATSGRSPVGNLTSHGTINTARVMQIKTAQRSAKTGPTSKTVASQPRSLAGYRKSIRKTMGY